VAGRDLQINQSLFCDANLNSNSIGNRGNFMSDALNKLEEETFFEDSYGEIPPTDIVAYNELRSCADLFRMKTQNILDISPDFQREVVWTPSDQTRFIDSLIKQLPIPSMCFAQDYKAQKWIVIDGLQRISTISRFLEGGDWTLSSLEDIDKNLAGKSVAAIKTSKLDLHQYYTRVENLSIPITVLRCDFKKRNHMEFLFTIFHRLNTGGTKLNNQEIRNCIYGGGLNNLLKLLDKNKQWRSLNKMTKIDSSYRFTKQEIILRFFSFFERKQKYEGHLAKFLNDYMHDHRHPSDDFVNDKTSLFNNTVEQIYTKIFESKAPGKLPITILEAMMVGIAFNLNNAIAQTPTQLKENYKRLLQHPKFASTALLEGLSKKPRVAERLDAAILIFAN
jgi:Protein of unknown function DUF262